MKKLQPLGIMLFALILLPAGVFAQSNDVSDKDLDLFVSAYRDVQQVQQEMNTKTSDMVDDSSLTHEEFQNLYQAYGNKDEAAINQFSQEQQNAFSELSNDITALQKSMQEDMIAAINDNNLSVDKFNAIMTAVQEDSDLYTKFQERFENN